MSVHWSARAALGEVGERLTQGEKAAVYAATWERIESEDDPQLKRLAGEWRAFASGVDDYQEQIGRLCSHEPPPSQLAQPNRQ